MSVGEWRWYIRWKERWLPRWIRRSLILSVAVVAVVAISYSVLVQPCFWTLCTADLHLHPEDDVSAESAKDRMDRNDVEWAGAGAKHGFRTQWEAYRSLLGGKFIAFAGQNELNKVYFDARDAALENSPNAGNLFLRAAGEAAMADATNPGIVALVAQAELDFQAGRIKGIGEIFVNNMRSHPDLEFKRKINPDAASMQLLYDLAAQYDGFLTVHMHADDDDVNDSVAGLKSLLQRPGGRILWNHCGSDTTADDVRPLLTDYDNLFCELSFRSPPVLDRPTSSPRVVFDENGIEERWRDLIEDFPDRFMIGTDAHNDTEYDGAIEMVRSNLLPNLSPETARMVDHENAQRLFGLR